MRLPTLGEVVSVAQRNVVRFPLVLLAGATTAYAALAMIEGSMNEPRLLRVMVAAGLGLPLLFGLAMLGERRSESMGTRLGIQGIGVAILVAVWWMWPRWTTEVQGMRLAQLSVAFHCFVAFAPFVGYAEPRAFWQYNRILFIRFLIGAVYSVVLWAGLSGALLALDKLLGVDIASEAYARLWVVIAFVFNPWFFVAGVPDDVGALEGVDDYPTGLRVFTQYVLVPIVAIYLVILTIYFGKVVATREWPKGWIGWLVSSVAGVGTLSWLLVHPLEGKPEHAWVKGFTRGFYVAIMPAIVMLWLAIYKRVDQYGVTENRYFLIILSVWLAGTAVYYTLSKSRNVKLIPASLCAVALLGFAGPWGAYSVSMKSQQARLATLLEAHGMMSGGQLRLATAPVSDSVAKQVSEGFRYLLERHGEEAVRPWISGDLEKKIGAIGSGNAQRANLGARAVVVALGVKYVERFGGTTGEYFSFYSPAARPATRIADYDYALSLSNNMAYVPPGADSVSGLRVRLVPSPPALSVKRDGTLIMTIPLGALVDSATAFRQRGAFNTLPPSALTLEFRDGDKVALVVLFTLSGTRTRAEVTVNSLDGELFLRLPAATEGRR